MPVNTEPLGAPACVYVSALHQRRNARAIFRRPYKTPPSKSQPCVDLMALVTIRVPYEDGSEIGRALINHHIRDESETNEVYSLIL